MRTISTLCGVMMMVVSSLPAQPVRKPASKGWVGKALPELKGHDGSDSEWLGRSPTSLEKLDGRIALVVLTSYD